VMSLIFYYVNYDNLAVIIRELFKNLYYIFGPYMLGLCLLGLWNWNNIVYVCDKSALNSIGMALAFEPVSAPTQIQNPNKFNNTQGDNSMYENSSFKYEKVLSASNVFSLISCFILSLIVILIIAMNSIKDLYKNSILNRREGNTMLRKAFWYFVIKKKSPQVLIDEINNANRMRNEMPPNWLLGDDYIPEDEILENNNEVQVIENNENNNNNHNNNLNNNI